MIKFHAIVINICVIKKFSLCDKTTLPLKNEITIKLIAQSSKNLIH